MTPETFLKETNPMFLEWVNAQEDFMKFQIFKSMTDFADKSKWISVEEMLPEETKNGVKVIGVIDYPKAKEWMYGNVCEVIFYSGKFHLGFKKGYIQNVTHWQPLPENP